MSIKEKTVLLFVELCVFSVVLCGTNNYTKIHRVGTE